MKKSTNETKEAATMYETENDIEQTRRSALIALMNQRLADAVDLQMQMKQAHWNVKGPHFIGLHELFDQIDEAVESYVDLIAERIVQLGGIAEGTARSAAARSRLEEYPLMALLTLRRLPWRCPLSDTRPVIPSMKPTVWATRTRRIFSPKSRAA
jgi:starvation-inducible DNA-binding protein